MLSIARDDFLRRYATSPIHVPRLERFLASYGDDDQIDAFCARFITWDRACPDADAARIVTEILSDGSTNPVRLRFSDDVVRGAIRWMGEVTSLGVIERAQVLREGVAAASTGSNLAFVEFLAAAGELAREQLDVEAFRRARH